MLVASHNFFRNAAIYNTVLLLLSVSLIYQCRPFRPGRISYFPRDCRRCSGLSSVKDLDFKRNPDTELFDARRMEIWWDGRYDTQIPPSIVFDELGENADRWLVDADAVSEKFASNNTTEILQVEGNCLKGLRDQTIVGTVVGLKDASGQEQALAAIGSVEWILIRVESSDSSWQMIPAENLIAAAQSTGTKIAFAVEKAADVAGLSKALELGVDALCISTKGGAEDPDLWKTAFQARKERSIEAEKIAASIPLESQPSKPEPQIVVGSCWRRDTKGTVLADRICVDLVQRLRPEEGCWIGSSAKAMTLVLSEAASSQFVPTRPFRVNAGPVHSYILLGDGTSTKYLCELQPSDQVMVYNMETNSSKAVSVGRLKEERRPCVLVEFETPRDDRHCTDEGSSASWVTRGQVFLQQAETVRLGQPFGNFLQVTNLEAQNCESRTNVKTVPLLMRVMMTGTHVGKVYTGKVEER